MKKILVAYATNSGTTADVARRIGEQLQKHGHQVDVFLLEEIPSLEAYEAVLLGAPMIVGWHRAARAFLKQHQARLAQIPVALFVTCMSLTQTNTAQVDGVPVSVDPDLPKPPARQGRLSFKERYATVENYLRPVLKVAPQVRPISVAFFGGRLDLYRLKWWQSLFVLLIIQAQLGDKRNWPAIEAWADSLAEL
ncbi:MAG: flavodoxin domain-containing protein [Chloroflexota bacterium]